MSLCRKSEWLVANPVNNKWPLVGTDCQEMFSLAKKIISLLPVSFSTFLYSLIHGVGGCGGGGFMDLVQLRLE